MQTTTFRRNVALAISSILLALSFIAALSFFSAAEAPKSAKASSVEYTVDADATLSSGSKNTNYGGREYVGIGTTSNYQSIMRFIVPDSAFTDLSSVTLYLEVSGANSSATATNKETVFGFDICTNAAAAAQEWPESSATWNSTAGSGDYPIRSGTKNATTYNLSDISKYAGNGSEIIEVTLQPSFFNDAPYTKEIDGTIYRYYTLRVYRSGGSNFYIWSKEKAANNSAYKAPTLIFNYSDGEEPEEPEVPEHLYDYEEGALISVKDTYVNINGSSYKSRNYGASEQIRFNRYCRPYIQFDTTDIYSTDLSGKYLSLYLNTVDDIADIDFTKISIYAIKNAKTDDTANFDWVEGTMSGTAPTEDDGSLTANNVADILPRIHMGSIYRHYDAENKVLRIDFPASVIADESFAQYDSENEKYYFTLMLNIPDASGMPGFYFYSKEGETAARFAPYLMLKDKALSIAQASVTLNDALTVNYYVTAEGYFANDALMLFTVAEGERECAAVETEEDHVYKFSLRLTPQLMAENVVAQYIDGETVIAEHSNFSVKSYLTALYNADGATAKVRTLVADLLAYGEAAKDYIGFESETAINDNATIAASATEFVAPEESAKAKTGEALENARFSGVTLLFDNVNKIGFKVAAADASAITVKVDGVALTATDLGNGVFVYLTDGIFANCFDNEISATMYLAEDDTEGETVTFSVNSYVYEIVASSENEKMITLAKALYNYGKAVTAYLAD